MNKYNITKSQSVDLYKLMKFTHDVLTRNKIDYWVTGGSLLGAVRHNGLIPWDDDGDICVMIDMVPKLRKIQQYCAQKGYELEQMNTTDNYGIKCCGTGKNGKDECDWYINSKNGDLGCDIFVMIHDPKRPGKITYANKYWRNESNGGKKCYYESEYVYPLVPLHFGNFFVYGPNNPVEHLNHCYGPGWNSQAQMLYNHRTGKWHSGKLRNMKVNDFKTIPPPKITEDNKPPPIIKSSGRNRHHKLPGRKSRKRSRKNTRNRSKRSSSRSKQTGYKSRRKYKNNSNQVIVRPLRESCTRMYTDRDKLIKYNNKDKLQGCSFGNCMYTDAMGKEHCASTVAKKYKNTPFSGECKLNNTFKCALGM